MRNLRFIVKKIGDGYVAICIEYCIRVFGKDYNEVFTKVVEKIEEVFESSEDVKNAEFYRVRSYVDALFDYDEYRKGSTLKIIDVKNTFVPVFASLRKHE